MNKQQRIIDLIVLLEANQKSRSRIGSDLNVADVRQRIAARRAYALTMQRYLDLTRELEDLTADLEPEDNMYAKFIGGAL